MVAPRSSLAGLAVASLRVVQRLDRRDVAVPAGVASRMARIGPGCVLRSWHAIAVSAAPLLTGKGGERIEGGADIRMRLEVFGIVFRSGKGAALSYSEQLRTRAPGSRES